MTPEHCDKPMYRDLNHDDLDMGRWACAEYGCAATITDTTLAAAQEMARADEHGIRLPGVTAITAANNAAVNFIEHTLMSPRELGYHLAMVHTVLEAAAPVIAAQAAAAEWERLLAALREFLPKYVTTIVHGHALDGAPIYAAGLLAFPDVLVDIFALMDTPDCDLLDGAQDAPQPPGAPPECQAMPEGPESRTGDRRDATR